MNPTELKRTSSQIMRALHSNDPQTMSEVATNPNLAPEERRGLPRVRSGVNIA